MLKLMYVCIAFGILAGIASLYFAPHVQAPSMVTDPNATTTPPDMPGTLCTMDAMQCPDGSYVGRTGAQCEFVCPAGKATTTGVSGSSTTGGGDISVTTPDPGSVLAVTTVITGKAKGTWYFEGSFPIQLLDSSGTLLAEAVATASDDWMTTKFVPFTSTLTFTNPDHLTVGILRFKNDNPSGLSAKDKTLDIPVRFAP